MRRKLDLPLDDRHGQSSPAVFFLSSASICPLRQLQHDSATINSDHIAAYVAEPTMSSTEVDTNIEDYCSIRCQAWFRLHEKGGKQDDCHNR
jgi:hypothetical protein